MLLFLMALATYRLTRLAVEDTFPPVVWARDRIIGGWRLPTTEEQLSDGFPTQLEEGDVVHVAGMGSFSIVDGEVQVYTIRKKWIPLFFAGLLSCPYCASGWIALGLTAGVWWWLGLALPLLVLLWLSAWALGGLLAAQDWA